MPANAIVKHVIAKPIMGIARTAKSFHICHAGLLGFPRKEVQYRFLSQFKSVFYIRQRDYSKSVAVSCKACGVLGKEDQEFWGLLAG